MSSFSVPATPQKQSRFEQLVAEIPNIGRQHHGRVLIDNAKSNKAFISKSLRNLTKPQGEKAKSGVVISAGPSVHRRGSIFKILQSGYKGTIIAADGAYIACLKAGLVPDYVVTLDPHPTRIARWFGDPNFEEHTKRDDYFARQDLDVEFRKNTIEQNKRHIELVNEHGRKSKAIICSASPRTVVERVIEARFDTYWWHPLVDDPTRQGSLTRELYDICALPCINTGGTVGTAAWVFAIHTLSLSEVAVVGMDLGYYIDTPLEKTQTYYELVHRIGGTEGIEEFFVKYSYPVTGEVYYTDPVYAWYRKNFLELFEKAPNKTYNCTEGGTLVDPRLECVPIDEFLNMVNGD